MTWQPTGEPLDVNEDEPLDPDVPADDQVVEDFLDAPIPEPPP